MVVYADKIQLIKTNNVFNEYLKNIQIIVTIISNFLTHDDPENNF